VRPKAALRGAGGAGAAGGRAARGARPLRPKAVAAAPAPLARRWEQADTHGLQQNIRRQTLDLTSGSHAEHSRKVAAAPEAPARPEATPAGRQRCKGRSTKGRSTAVSKQMRMDHSRTATDGRCAHAHTQTPTHAEKSGSGAGGAGGAAGGRVVSGAAVELEVKLKIARCNSLATQAPDGGTSASQRRYHVI
jgi:hypothetical protein